MLELSKRLLMSACMVSPGAVVADVGCDHGYVPIYLVERKICPRVIAMDINDGPLMRAEMNIREYGFSEQIETRKSDGLSDLRPGEADTMIAAGMGGNLMQRILLESTETVAAIEEFILQPQSDIPRFREFLNSHGFCIIAEDMVFEEGKYYTAMKAVHGEEPPFTSEELTYGRILLESMHPVLLDYLKWESATKREILESLATQTTGRAKARTYELKAELKQIGEIIKRYEM